MKVCSLHIYPSFSAKLTSSFFQRLWQNPKQDTQHAPALVCIMSCCLLCKCILPSVVVVAPIYRYISMRHKLCCPISGFDSSRELRANAGSLSLFLRTMGWDVFRAHVGNFQHYLHLLGTMPLLPKAVLNWTSRGSYRLPHCITTGTSSKMQSGSQPSMGVRDGGLSLDPCGNSDPQKRPHPKQAVCRRQGLCAENADVHSLAALGCWTTSFILDTGTLPTVLLTQEYVQGASSLPSSQTRFLWELDPGRGGLQSVISAVLRKLNVSAALSYTNKPSLHPNTRLSSVGPWPRPPGPTQDTQS